MAERERIELIKLVEKRIGELESELSDSRSILDKLRDLEGDAEASLNLTINASVEEKILSEHKQDLAQLRKNLAWLHTDDAGMCDDCGCDIPIDRLKAVLSTRLCIVCAGISQA